MKPEDFKNEFRLMCTDTWGDALDAWFECAGQMYNRGLPIPYEWEYSPGIEASEPDSYFHEIFTETSDESLIVIGAFCSGIACF